MLQMVNEYPQPVKDYMILRQGDINDITREDFDYDEDQLRAVDN